jgi:hypothetical protein
VVIRGQIEEVVKNALEAGTEVHASTLKRAPHRIERDRRSRADQAIHRT